MFGCECLCWNKLTDLSPSASDPEIFSLPSPLPNWPKGQGFASGTINLGALEVSKITELEPVWRRHNPSRDNTTKGLTFYKPNKIPIGFHCLGHYCHRNNHPLTGHLLVARAAAAEETLTPALREPLDYVLVWAEETFAGLRGHFWLPLPPEGYKAAGFLVTTEPEKPGLDEARCVRADLTEECEPHKLLLDCGGGRRIWTTRPRRRGMMGRGVSLGTFLCSAGSDDHDPPPSIACLKNLNPTLHAMPNLDQVRALIEHYGPTVFFHPQELYLPSSVQWFFENGALLYRAGESSSSSSSGEPIESGGANLPAGGTNDGAFWIDLPADSRRREAVKHGNLESARLYAHVKPAEGGSFTDVAMWLFCPYNGPATLKAGAVSVAMGKVGGHVCDWEHFTLRICNFTGELRSVYYSQHSGGEWVEAHDLEFVRGNRAAVYSSRNGHASYPRGGTYIQGSALLGVGIRNDASRGGMVLESSERYEVVAAEYLGDGVVAEPRWLQYMRLWGPAVVYGSRTELDKVVGKLPPVSQNPAAASWFGRLPAELYGEVGPTGPKEKNNWVGDERG